jgi:spermidine synthase
MYSPFAIRLLLRSAQRSGVVSGTVYGVSTAGSIVGTLGTTFFLIPSIGSRAITLSLGAAGIVSGLLLIALPRFGARRLLLLLALAALAAAPASAQELIDEAVRAALLKRPDGQIARIETEYNDIFITKRRTGLTMSFQLKGFDYTESVANLQDPDDMPVLYTRAMTAALAYPAAPKRLLMIGLGGGSISTYLGRAMPELAIDTVELDPGVIGAAKKYFGIRETARVRYLDGDGRVFLKRNRELYDVVLVDAFHGGYVPFHLLTREFYALVKERLAEGGVAAFNVHDGTKLTVSTLITLQAVFGGVQLLPSGEGETIMLATAQAGPDSETLAARAAALQERHRFRYPLPELLRRRIAELPERGLKGELITDDFAPVNLYDTIGARDRKRK